MGHSRKHYPTQDIAAAGGWYSTATLDRCYLQADPETVLKVVLSPNELHEKKA